MKMADKFASALTAILTIFVAVHVFAATPTTAPATQPVTAKVLKVTGKFVQHSTDGSTWTKTKPNDILPANTFVRTGLNSTVLIQLRETAILQIRSAAKVLLADMLQSPNTESTRVSLTYGTVRAGIIEGPRHSDFTIATPTAVLSREGTWGIEMSYDPATGHYFAGLDTEGLIRIVNTTTGQRMVLSPGQFTTQLMQRWVQTATFQRTVTFTDPFGVTQVERVFYAQNPGGRTVVNPTGPNETGAGFTPNNLSSAQNLQRQLENPINTLPNLNILPDLSNPDRSAPVYNYRFGNFGTRIPESEKSSLFKR
jgi:hypothetical protein